MPALDWESAWVTTIFAPRMPPLALISPTARSMPFFQFVPTVAPEPDNSATSARLIVAADCAGQTAGNALANIAAPSAASLLFIRSSLALSSLSNVLGCAMHVSTALALGGLPHRDHPIEGRRHHRHRRRAAGENLERVHSLVDGELAPRHHLGALVARRAEQGRPQGLIDGVGDPKIAARRRSRGAGLSRLGDMPTAVALTRPSAPSSASSALALERTRLRLTLASLEMRSSGSASIEADAPF